VTTPGGTNAGTAASTISLTAPKITLPPPPADTSAIPAPPTPFVQYRYNGDGLRTASAFRSSTTHFTWDVTRAVPRLLQDADHTFVYGPDGLTLEQIDKASVANWFFHDGNGTTRALLAPDGTIGASFKYQPYGAIKSKTGTLTTPILYAQSYSDPLSGFDYLVHRYYDPTRGQFLTTDPAVEMTGKPYGYADGDPINRIDPTGQFSILHAAALVVGIVGGSVLTAGIIASSPVILGVGLVAVGVGLAAGLADSAITCARQGAQACNGSLLDWSIGGVLSVGGAFAGGSLGDTLEGIGLYRDLRDYLRTFGPLARSNSGVSAQNGSGPTSTSNPPRNSSPSRSTTC